MKGIYVYCPGCGHGGHLEHALQWFGGIQGKPVREVCPTGCGEFNVVCYRLKHFKLHVLIPRACLPQTYNENL